MNNRAIRPFLALLFFFLAAPGAHAQVGKITFDLQKDKPAKYKNKTLRSEKTGEKKFTLPRKFVQNTVSHYNYFFNANNKIAAVIEQARMAHTDDYSKLLSYYSYSLDQTAMQKQELDSVIIKATAGILLHDLRSNWVDDLYLLIGQAYYLRKDFDSATMTFQFINYNLYPRKKKGDDDQLIVGSHSNDQKDVVSIASKENRNLVDKALTRPPGRNDALVWLARTLTDTAEFAEAAGLISTLKNDPYFPERLMPYFEEVQGYWFFSQGMYDSAISHIKKAMPNAIDLADKARREYLLAQLYEMYDSQDTASYYYSLAMKHTTDPLMDIYANLNKAKMLKTHDPEEITKSIDRLLKMARKDKFEPYRDIVYYSAAQLALEIPDTASAKKLLLKSTRFPNLQASYKEKAFLQLAEIAYNQKNYRESFNFYDSLRNATDTTLDLASIKTRRNALLHIVEHLNVIQREDSLQALAKMPEAEREDFLKKLSKKLRKEQGAQENGDAYTPTTDFTNSGSLSTGAFTGNQGNSNEWYFYNNSLKSKGYTEFKRIWGKRKNNDSWRISSLKQESNGDLSQNNAFGDPMDATQQDAAAERGIAPIPQNDISADGLRANLPLTPALLDSSDARIAHALFELGKNYQTLLEDYEAAISAYDSSLKRFPDSLYGGELYSNLAFCYRKTGNTARAEYYTRLLLTKYPKTKYADYALHPEKFEPAKKDAAATSRYDAIYNLFIEGNFDKAIAEKNAADSVYGTSYWNPQLLYIQSVYYIQKKQDSAAIKTLKQIVSLYPGSPMKEKAATLIDVVSRRDSIERYLTDLKVERVPEDSQIVAYDDPKITRQQLVQDTTRMLQPGKAREIGAPPAVALDPDKKAIPVVKNKVFAFDPYEPQYVMMVLTKVDPVYVSEARNAFTRYNTQQFYSQQLKIEKDTLDSDRMLLLFEPFAAADEAIKYLDKIKAEAPTQVSWLPPQKYTFYIISAPNLLLLKENKNLDSYTELLRKQYPGKF